MAAPRPALAFALECSLVFHVADAALAVVLDILGEVDEVLDVLLLGVHIVSRSNYRGRGKGGRGLLARLWMWVCGTYISQILHDVEILPRGLELVPALLDRFLADQVAGYLRPFALGGIPLPLVPPRLAVVGCHHGSVVD